MRSYDFIIVGLGTAGSATCMTLARRGYRVLGLDQFSPPHTRGSHHGLSRSVRRAYPEGSSYVMMAQKSWELWRKLEKDSGRRLLIKTGNLTLGPPDCPALSGFLHSAQKHGILHEYLSALEVEKRWPQFSLPDYFYAGLESEAGIVFPEPAITAFLDEGRQAAADLHLNEGVKRWTEHAAGVEVRTSRASYHGGRLLLAAGAWSRNLSGRLSAVLTPKRIAVHWVEPVAEEPFSLGRFPVNFWQVPVCNDPVFPEGFKEFYSLPMLQPGGQIKVAFHNGLSDGDPDSGSKTIRDDETTMINEMIAAYLPGLAGCPMQVNACFYTMTPDKDFYLGRLPESQHVFGAALAGHGFKFAPLLGELLADLLLDLPSPVDISMFSPERFKFYQQPC